ncbi:MAG: hypothetical protein ABSA53_32305 [Streptosporangiaceae bacterium]
MPVLVAGVAMLTKLGDAASPSTLAAAKLPLITHMSAISQAQRITMMWYRDAAVMEVVAGDSALT